MRYAMIASQGIDDTEIIASSDDMGERIQLSALANIFPAGSDWGDYVGARSFRFVPVAYRNYLLSYTLILDERRGEWEGQLHSWGLVGPAEMFLTDDALGGYSPRELFGKNSYLFTEDPLFDTMLEGLEPADPSTNKIRFPWWFRFLPYGKRLGFSWKFSNPTQWSHIENWLYLVFLGSLRRGFLFLPAPGPKTFSTLTLSTCDPSELIGYPDANKSRPIWGFV